MTLSRARVCCRLLLVVRVTALSALGFIRSLCVLRLCLALVSVCLSVLMTVVGVTVLSMRI